MRAEVVRINKISRTDTVTREDLVAEEMSFEVCVSDADVFSMSCTPADMEELLTGMLFSRGYMKRAEEIESIDMGPRIFVTLQKGPAVPEPVMSKEAPVSITENIIFSMGEKIFENPGELFRATGCAHSCTLVMDEEILCSYEDIGRHNALDKVIGYGLKHHIPFEKCVVFTSGRISGDYLMKLVKAGIFTVVSRAAVTGEAVRLAEKYGVTMYGFARGNTVNRYH